MKDRKEDKAAVAANRDGSSGRQPATGNLGAPDQDDDLTADPNSVSADDDNVPPDPDEEMDQETTTAPQDDSSAEDDDEYSEEEDDGNHQEQSDAESHELAGPLSLADELGVHELNEIVFVDQGRLFSAAGRSAPIAELTEDEDLVLRPPDKPLSDDLVLEKIEIQVDDRGILLNELGERRMFAGTKYKGRSLFYLAETVPDSSRHYVGFFDTDGNLGKLYLQGRPVTTDIIYKLRVRTHDGELGVFPELSDDPNAHQSGNDPQ